MRNPLLKISLIFFLLLAYGCVTHRESIKDGEELGKNEGLLLVYADLRWVGTNRDLRPGLELSYKPSDNSFSLEKIRFFNNVTVRLIRVPAGEYVLTHCFFGFDLLGFPKPIPFTIKPGQVTYLGHFNGEVTWPKIGLLSDRRLKIDENAEAAKKDLSNRYPKLSSQVQFLNYAAAGILAKEF